MMSESLPVSISASGQSALACIDSLMAIPPCAPLLLGFPLSFTHHYYE
jgi:hypothetical protein